MVLIISCKEGKPGKSSDESVIGTKADSVETNIYANYSREQLEEAKKYMPGGVKINNEKIARDLRIAWADSSRRPQLIPALKPDSTQIPSRSEIKKRMIDARGMELSQIKQELIIDGKPFPGGTRKFNGMIERITENEVTIRDSLKNQQLVLDYYFTTGIDLSAIKAKSRVAGIFHKNIYPYGVETSVSMRDGRGLLFASEVRGLNAVLNQQDLDGIQVRQLKENIVEPAYKTKCAEVYYVGASVTGENTKNPIVIEHGKHALLNKGNRVYLITIVKSQYIKEIPCGSSFEENPWQLEYTITRIDNPALIKELNTDIELMQNEFPADDIRPEIMDKPDAPPNPKLKGGDN